MTQEPDGDETMTSEEAAELSAPPESGSRGPDDDAQAADARRDAAAEARDAMDTEAQL